MLVSRFVRHMKLTGAGRRAALFPEQTARAVELGEYDRAIGLIQKMVDLKPQLSSYSRVSYLRELHGDIEGAIQAMSMALYSGSPSRENTAWCVG